MLCFAPYCRCIENNGNQTISTSYYHEPLNITVPSWSVNTTWGSNGVLARFDNVIMALWVLVQIASLENWSGIMYAAMQTTGVDNQPLLNANNSIAIFFVVFIILCSFFILNMIIGVSIDKVRVCPLDEKHQVS